MTGLLLLGSVWLAPTTGSAQESHLDLTATTSSTGNTPGSVLCLILLGLLLGIAGQAVRSLMGIKKELDDAQAGNTPPGKWFNAVELTVSLVLGGVAGTLAAILMLGAPIDQKFLFACVAAGYAGSDFIQSILQIYLPANPNAIPANPGAQQGGGGGAAATGGNPQPPATL